MRRKQAAERASKQKSAPLFAFKPTQHDRHGPILSLELQKVLDSAKQGEDIGKLLKTYNWPSKTESKAVLAPSFCLKFTDHYGCVGATPSNDYL